MTDGARYHLDRVAHVPSQLVDVYATSQAAIVFELGPLALLTMLTVTVGSYGAIQQLLMVAHLHRPGGGFDVVGLAWQFRWGGGL